MAFRPASRLEGTLSGEMCFADKADLYPLLANVREKPVSASSSVISIPLSTTPWLSGKKPGQD